MPKAFEVDAVVRRYDYNLYHGDRDKPLEELECKRVCWTGLTQRHSHNNFEIRELSLIHI